MCRFFLSRLLSKANFGFPFPLPETPERAIFQAFLFLWDFKNLSYFAEKNKYKNSEVRLSSIGEKIWNRNSL